MIEIKVNVNSKKTEIKCNAHIEDYKNAVNEFYLVIKALSELDESALVDAMGAHVTDRFDEILGGDDDDESES